MIKIIAIITDEVAKPISTPPSDSLMTFFDGVYFWYAENENDVNTINDMISL